MARFLKYLAAVPHIGQDLDKLPRDIMHNTNAVRVSPRFPDLVHHHAVHLLQLLHAEPAGIGHYFVEEILDEVRIDWRLRGRAIRVEQCIYAVVCAVGWSCLRLILLDL